MESQNEIRHGEDDVIDVEEFARAGKPVPKDKRYRIRVDKQTFVVETETITGQRILALVGKTPGEYNLYQHVHGGRAKLIQPDEVVDLTAPGVERFTSMKVENKEGE